MKPKNKQEEKPLVKEGNMSMDFDTYNKVKGKLKSDDNVTITDKKPNSSISSMSDNNSTSSSMAMAEGGVEPEAIIEPQDKATIKYLSNVKDSKTGDISKPFTIGDKRYQMVRGITPSKEIVMAVYCHDDTNEAGENLIHPIEYFEENIAKPMLHKANETKVEPVKTAPISSPAPQTSNNDKALASLKLAEFKHFLVNKNNGKMRKFKRNEDLAKATMDVNETYMNLNELKKYMEETLFGPKRSKMVETDLPERPDVSTAMDQMVQKMKPYMIKLNEPLEKMQFIAKLVSMLQLDTKFYPKLIALIKQGSTLAAPSSATQTNTTDTTQTTNGGNGSIAENKVITKNELQESLTKKKVIKTIKIKDIK